MSSFDQQRTRPQRGFTYLALLMLLSMFALASSLTLQVAEQSARRESEQELLAVGKAFRVAFKSYYLQTPLGTQRYPMTLEALARDPRYPGVKRHLRRVYADPLTGKSDWGLIQSPEGGIMGVYSKAEGKPIREQFFSKLTPVVPMAPGQALTDPLVASPGVMAVSAASSPDGALSYREWQFGYVPSTMDTAAPRVNGLNRNVLPSSVTQVPRL